MVAVAIVLPRDEWTQIVRREVRRMMWKAALVCCILAATVLAGCSGGTTAVNSDASMTSTPMGAAAPATANGTATTEGGTPSLGPKLPAFSIGAPEFQPGDAWMWRWVDNGTVDSGDGPVSSTHTWWEGARLLSNSYTKDGANVAVGTRFYSTKQTTLATAKGQGAAMLDPATLDMQSLGDFKPLHACQSNPATCPTTLDITAPQGFTGSVPMHFPLTPGATWTTRSADPATLGSVSSRVVGLQNVTVVGRTVLAVHVRAYGNYTLSNHGETATLHIVWDADYSPEYLAVVREVLRGTGEFTTKDGTGTFDGTTERTLDEFARQPQAEPDPVDLYDDLGLYGRHIYVSYRRVGADLYNITVTPKEVPLDGVHLVVLDAERNVVSEHAELNFTLRLDPGSYILRAEALHNGRVLASYEYPVAQFLQKFGISSCATPTANPPVAPSTGVCSDFPVVLRPGTLSLTIRANVNDITPTQTTGKLELLDAAGAIVQSITIVGRGDLILPSVPEGHRGTWNVRFIPDESVQARVFYQITGFYSQPKAAASTP